MNKIEAKTRSNHEGFIMLLQSIVEHCKVIEML